MPPVNIINDRSRAGLKMDRTFNHSQLAFNSVTSVTGSKAFTSDGAFTPKAVL